MAGNSIGDGLVSQIPALLVSSAVALLVTHCVRRLGGVTGDVFGAANEIGRLAGLHAGVIVWTLL